MTMHVEPVATLVIKLFAIVYVAGVLAFGAMAIGWVVVMLWHFLTGGRRL